MNQRVGCFLNTSGRRCPVFMSEASDSAQVLTPLHALKNQRAGKLAVHYLPRLCVSLQFAHAQRRRWKDAISIL